MRMTYRIAHSLGTDAANRRMRQDGRTTWNEEDFNLAADMLRKHFPVCFEVAGIDPEMCVCTRCLPGRLNQQLAFNI